MWDVNVEFSDHDIIVLYHAHGESEQFHSEIKTDMNLELFPSGKFDTNELVLELAMSAYNILRIIGDETIHHITKHARKFKIEFDGTMYGQRPSGKCACRSSVYNYNQPQFCLQLYYHKASLLCR